jgi:hypothetical protein
MKVADYDFVAYKITTKEGAIRQIDRVWEKHKGVLIQRWLDKVSVAGRAPLNKKVEGLYHDFKRAVFKEMSPVFGGNNKMEDGVNVNMAIERVLRGKMFQSKDQLLRTNMLARIEGSPMLRQLQKIDPSITAEDIISNADYVRKLSTSIDGLVDGLEQTFDETYDKVFEYLSPSGRVFLIYVATSDSPQRFI